MKTYTQTAFKIALVICISFFSNASQAQTSIEIGQTFTINSKILDSDRDILISLPKSYTDTVYAPKSYPVCYFFDGDTHIENFSTIRNWLTRNLYASMPEVIMVGIVQKDRTNELTPTAMETPKAWKRANFSTSGGNKAFMDFIEDELKPYINANYRTNGYNILSGHSFGGLATMNCFVNTPQYYNAYIAIDPSMWWNNKHILNKMNQDWITKEHANKRLFVAKANDPGSGEDHHKANLELHDKLNALKETANFEWQFKFYDTEDHGSVVIPAEYDGIRFIYENYQLPVKKAMKNPELIDAHIATLSDKFGYKVLPDESLIDQLAAVCKRQDFFEQYKTLLYKNTIYYPNSKHAQEAYKNALENK